MGGGLALPPVALMRAPAKRYFSSDAARFSARVVSGGSQICKGALALLDLLVKCPGERKKAEFGATKMD